MPSNQAVSEAGRHLVAAEALLRGHAAELRESGRQRWVQVNQRRVEVHTAIHEWPLRGARLQPDADLVVFVGRGGDVYEFFIATRAEAIKALDAHMEAWLDTQPGRERPQTPETDQQTLKREVAEPWRDRWDLLGRGGRDSAGPARR